MLITAERQHLQKTVLGDCGNTCERRVGSYSFRLLWFNSECTENSKAFVLFHLISGRYNCSYSDLAFYKHRLQGFCGTFLFLSEPHAFDTGSSFCYLRCKIIKPWSYIIESNVENQTLFFLK